MACAAPAIWPCAAIRSRRVVGATALQQVAQPWRAVVAAEAEAAIAIAHAGQLGLATHAREALDPSPRRILYEMQSVVQEVVMFQGDGALVVIDQRHRPMDLLDPATQFV